MRKIKSIVIHCSASSFGNAKIIDSWHKARGWREIGYHYVINNGKSTNKYYDLKRDGLVEAGRSLDNDVFMEWNERGAHSKGHNRASIGICLIGTKSFTPKQLEAMIYICRYWIVVIPDIKIIAHRELSSYKTCPNMDPEDLRHAIKNASVMAAIEGRLSKYFS